MILIRNFPNHKTTIQYETILWDPDDILVFESESTDYDHENEAKNVLDLGILEDISDSETYYDESNSKQMINSPKNNPRPSLTADGSDSDSDSSYLSSSSYFTPLPPDEDTEEKTLKQSNNQTNFQKRHHSTQRQIHQYNVSMVKIMKFKYYHQSNKTNPKRLNQNHHCSNNH